MSVHTFPQSPFVRVVRYAPWWYGAIVLTTFVGAYVAMAWCLSPPGTAHFLILLLILAAGITAGSVPIILPWLSRTLRYEILSDAVVIVRRWPLRSTTIPLASITHVTRPKTAPVHSGWLMRGTLRSPLVELPDSDATVILQQGYFGYKVGAAGIKIIGAVTDPNRLVLIEGKRNFLLSPENPDEFADHLRSRL